MIRPASSTSGTANVPAGEALPQLEGIGEIKLESVDRAGGYWTTRSDGPEPFHTRTSGIYLRADPGDRALLEGSDAAERAALIERRLEEWKSSGDMSSRGDFTDEEWTRLGRAPLLAGLAITLSDPGGPIEAVKESGAAFKTVLEAAREASFGVSSCNRWRTTWPRRRSGRENPACRLRTRPPSRE